MAYLRRFLITVFALLGTIAALNALIDPFDLLGAPVFAGINQVKAPGNDRFFKPIAVELDQPRTVFVGTSRVVVGLDPHDLPGENAYNLGLLGSATAEHIAFARYAIAHAPVERLIIGLDFASFVSRTEFSPSFKLAILGRFVFWRALPEMLISQSALLQSRVAFTQSRRRAKPRYAADGMLLAANEPSDGSTPTQRILRKVDEYARFYHWAPGPEAALAEFDAFLAQIPPRVAVFAYVTPAHAALSEALSPSGLGPVYDLWLRRVTAICAEHHVPLWDFNGYNRVTTVPFATSGEDFIDGAHTTPAIGRLVLDTLLRGATVPDFGVRLTPDMLPAYLETQHTAAQAWRRDHPEDASLAAETAFHSAAQEAARGSGL
jgi:hypothetical protein